MNVCSVRIAWLIVINTTGMCKHRVYGSKFRTPKCVLTGRSDTQSIPSLLEVIKDWMANDGTFLYTYHGNMRLGLNQDCPLEIASFSQPECGNNHFKTEMRIEL